MDTLVASIRQAVRSLWRHKGLSALAVLCMGLGIGTCVTIFTSVNPWLFRPLPYPDSDRLVGLRATIPREGSEWNDRGLSAPDYLDWQGRARSYEGMGAFQRADYNLSEDQQPERAREARVTATLFPVLGIAPTLGRGFTAEEDQPGASVALIGHSLWQRRFGGDPAVLGRTLHLDGSAHTIVGVMPERFAFPEYAEVWTLLGLEHGRARRDKRGLEALARLKPGVGPAQAHQELNAICADLAREHPDTNEGRGGLVRPYLEGLTPPGVILGMYLLLGAGLFVQLIASANVANLLLVKATGQRQEIAVRLALGAGRGRVLRQFLVETLILTGVGASLGLLLGSLGAERMSALTPIRPPFWVSFDPDVRVIAFTVAVSALSALLVSLVPAFQAGRASLLEDLKEGGRALTSGVRTRLGRLLVVSELAVALVLLIAAALMVQKLHQRFEANPGLDMQGVVTARLALAGESYSDPERRAAFLEELLQRLRALPEVRDAGAASGLPFRDPLEGSWRGRSFEIEGQPVEPGHTPVAVYFSVLGDHLPAAGIPLQKGRVFTREEEEEGREVVMVSEALAERFWGGADPVDRRLRIDSGPWLRVVGVAREVRDPGDMVLTNAKPPGQLYVPYRRDVARAVSLVVRTRTDPAGFAPTLRDVVRSLDPALPVDSVLTMDEVRRRSAWVARMWGQMLSQVAALALMMAALGVFGVVSYSVSQRTHEIGIRMALGAARGGVMRLVLGDGLRLALQAVALGLAGAFALTRTLARLLYGVDALDPSTLVGCAAALLLAALLATTLPAWRGTRVDPIVALRSE